MAQLQVPLVLALPLLALACSSSETASHADDDAGARGTVDASSTESDTGGSPANADASSGGSTGGSRNGAGGGANGGANGGRSAGAGGEFTTEDGSVAVTGQRVSDFLGVNAFVDDDPVTLAAIGNVREYHQWVWNDGNGVAGYKGYPDNQLEFSLWGGFWDFDDYYGKLTKAGAMVFPCIQGSVDYLNGAMPPVAGGADATDPTSYAAHASFLYQYAARYGKAAVAPSRLKLASGQKVASGLGLLPYYEDGNETDANWIKPDGAPLFSPEATAAMSSADYDGHRGALGATAGIKSADPDARLVLAGLSGTGPKDWFTNVTTYLAGMQKWADDHRGGAFPADVINVHDYCFGPDAFGTKDPRPGISPEECGLEALLAKLVAYRDQKLPGKEVWLTEFGYDTHPKSRLRAPAIDSASAEVVQGQWLVRSILALLASGIDRAFLFVSRDSCTGSDTACPNNDVQFSTSGVLTQKGDEKPKAAWYYLATFKSRLGAMRYQGTVPSGIEQVSIARFYDPENDKGAFVVWAPTSTGTVTKDYALSVNPKLTSVSVVTLANGSKTGTETATSVTNAHASLNITETPTLVLVEGRP